MPDCDFEYQIVTHYLYKFTQYYTAFVSLLVIIIMYLRLWKQLYKSVFQKNLKFLFFSFFGMIFIFSVLQFVLAMYQAIKPYFITNYCDLIYSQLSYRYLHILTLLSMSTTVFFPLVISFERLIAMSNTATYEYSKLLLGPILMLLAVSFNTTILFIVYDGETFSESTVTYTNIPSTSSTHMNMYYGFLLIVNLPNFAISLFIQKRNLYLKKRLQLDASLTRKYAVEEIIQSTKFTFGINMMHLTFFGCFLTFIFIFRSIRNGLFQDLVIQQVVRGLMLLPIPTINLPIVILCSYMLESFNRERSKKIAGSVKIKYTGAEGVKNHDDAIFQIWNNYSKK
ncbi:unnamed protein product [Caenorhabditis angaria]|uniref:G-protein coupled receptors family 1 profile domain-containing protein n=1 Tax=Caenorhabditis angaria TaxID=860376 RepID=A0A9P1IBW7_9PELO|nr:unnamed protein product [Caenorhabditis angaria]